MSVTIAPSTNLLPRQKLPDELVDIIFECIYVDCVPTDDSPNGFCEANPCLHARTLNKCLLVSKKWFKLGVGHLWGGYASLRQLLTLSQGFGDDGFCVSEDRQFFQLCLDFIPLKYSATLITYHKNRDGRYTRDT